MTSTQEAVAKRIIWHWPLSPGNCMSQFSSLPDVMMSVVESSAHDCLAQVTLHPGHLVGSQNMLTALSESSKFPNV